MTLPVSTTPFLNQALIQVLGQAAGTKAQAQDALATLQAGPVTADWVFNFLAQANAAISNFNRFKNVTGLDAYAQAQVPGYGGTMSADITGVVAAIQTCVNWVVTNFPKDSTKTYLLAYTALASDGSKTPRSFSSTQTSQLQTNLQALIALIG